LSVRRAFRCVIAALCVAGVARAEPWLPPGDEGLRSDIELLADAGIVRGPVTTWPISWPDLSRDVVGAGSSGLDAATADALLRVQRRARDAAVPGFSGYGLRVSGSYHPDEFRGFAATPRESGEAGLSASWLGNHLALNLRGTVVTSPDDDKTFRPDGSYLGVNVGNFMVSAGFVERWWGPGWDGGLILSTNARPIPGVQIERNYSDAFRSPLLHWIGPWRASIALGEAESHDVAVADVRFLAARVNFKPTPWAEFGLSRTAQWCGRGRECGWRTFTNMLLGHDNQVDDGSTAKQPGNQMAGYDMRLRSPWKKLPLAVYTQWIGEDEAGGLPSKFIGQLGVETWASTGLGGLRVRAEFSDTACNFTRANPEFDCAYRNAIYPQGYAYRGRNIGHSIDRDGRMYSTSVQLAKSLDELIGLTLRRIDLNRGGGDHPISAVPLTIDDVELRYSRPLWSGRVSLGLGYQRANESSDLESGARGFLNWQQGF
jgi:hypothetical protein